MWVDKDSQLNQFIEAEFKRMVDTYGNHPSFCTMTLGNEYSGTNELLTRWIGLLIQRDPRHLYSRSEASTLRKLKTANGRSTGAGAFMI